jgi:hypothetical protein
VNVHDFPDDAVARAVPYGIYDLVANLGWLYVGLSADTSEFAVGTIALWWAAEGRCLYPTARRLLILADSGGSNGCRVWAWKERLQRRLADEFGLEVTVCHYPAGCSKWNPVEHRLFGPISLNWAGIPLRSLDTMLSLIRGTRTKTGLKVEAKLMEGSYETGRKVAKKLMDWLDLVPHDVCPRWNYTLRPRPLSDPPDKPGLQRIMRWDWDALTS